MEMRDLVASSIMRTVRSDSGSGWLIPIPESASLSSGDELSGLDGHDDEALRLTALAESERPCGLGGKRPYDDDTVV